MTPQNNFLSSEAISVRKAAANLPQGTAAAKFTVSGTVAITDIIGEVTTAIEAGANNMKLIANPTSGADVDLCTTVDIDAAAVGTKFNITGTLTDAMAKNTGAAFTYTGASIVIVKAGTIDLSCSASKTGQIKWTLYYVPIDAGARVY
jgi:hypothetical protein